MQQKGFIFGHLVPQDAVNGNAHGTAQPDAFPFALRNQPSYVFHREIRTAGMLLPYVASDDLKGKYGHRVSLIRGYTDLSFDRTFNQGDQQVKG
ncbi:hypothetical protein AVM02_19030 [Brucella anthropi]|uniref:hypothetical protein n=1 Tax=Brucella anthropi TaxID=529 RepID=UPI003987B3B8